MESAAEATETASKAMELSAKEFEQSNLMLQAETPTMMAEIEAAAKEYNELGQTLKYAACLKTHIPNTAICNLHSQSARY